MYLWAVVVKSEELVAGFIVKAETRISAEKKGIVAWYEEHEEEIISVETNELGTPLFSDTWKAREFPNRKVESWPISVVASDLVPESLAPKESVSPSGHLEKL